ncbi:MAG: hypothetical protein Q8L86_16695 [Vicinamibacterales bacterium]|nr:hypothetical protein [Vicinamibacterales bacterium]
MRTFVRREAVWVALLVVCAAAWGASYVQRWRDAGRAQSFYQEYFEPAVMIGCGRGFVAAEVTPAEVKAFLEQRADAVDCAALPDGMPVVSTGLYQYAWFYLMWMVGAFWMMAGVSWSGLVPLFGALFAVVIGLAYAIVRLVVPPSVAWVAAAGLMASSLHLENLPHLRDYAKAPFVLGLLLILFAIVRRPTPFRVIALSGLYGLVLGIGYGVRTDFLAHIPLLPMAVLVFVPGFDARALAAKAAALVAAAVMFVVASWPVVSYVVNQGGCQWHVALVGLDHQFTRDLGVAPSYYQWISRSSDEYVHAAVNGFAYRTEGAAPVPYCSAEYDRASGRYLASIATAFPADVLTRAYASTLRIIDLPLFQWTAGPGAERSTVGHAMTYFVGTARLATMAAVLALGAWSWRVGLFALAIVLYCGAYPSLQFGSRHFFHLEFIGWGAIAFVVWLGVSAARAWRGRETPPWRGHEAALTRRAVQFATVAILGLLTPLFMARVYQDARFLQLRTALLESPRVPVAMAPDADGAFLRVSDQAALDTGPDETGTVYLDIQLDLDACPEGVPLATRYEVENPVFDFSWPIQPQPATAVPARVLLPAYEGFAGLALNGAPARCVTSVHRVPSAERLPLLPILTLPAEWERRPAHQRVGGMALRLGWYGL